jgi:hypothetical protein
VLVNHYQGEQLCQFLEKPTTVMTLLSISYRIDNNVVTVVGFSRN